MLLLAYNVRCRQKLGARFQPPMPDFSCVSHPTTGFPENDIGRHTLTPIDSNLFLVGWVRMDWVGLDRIGLGWVGLGWVGLGWVGLGWVGVGWVGLGI